jgi:hypothetical protein
MYFSILVTEGQTHLLITSWLLGLGAAIFAREAAKKLWDKSLALPGVTGEPFTNLAQLREFEPQAKARNLLLSVERDSIVWPLIAVSMLGLLSLHFLA